MTCSHPKAPLFVLPVFLLPIGPDPAPPVTPETHTVEITHDGYAPAALMVRHGDIIRFVQRDAPAHNIEFHRTPAGTALAPAYEGPISDLEVFRPAATTARIGPFLIGEGRTYEIRIGEEMPEGAYVFGCSRHAKWRGSLVINDTEAFR
jgi:plastocyanin